MNRIIIILFFVCVTLTSVSMPRASPCESESKGAFSVYPETSYTETPTETSTTPTTGTTETSYTETPTETSTETPTETETGTFTETPTETSTETTETGTYTETPTETTETTNTESPTESYHDKGIGNPPSSYQHKGTEHPSQYTPIELPTTSATVSFPFPSYSVNPIPESSASSIIISGYQILLSFLVVTASFIINAL